MSAPQHSPDHSSNASIDASIDASTNASTNGSTDAERAVTMQSWLDAPNFDIPNFGDDTDEWAAIDDHDRLLVDGHLSDLGVSVLADLQVGVVDASEGLDPHAVQSSIMHLAQCSTCPARVASVAGWAREIAVPVPVPVPIPAPAAGPVAVVNPHSAAGVPETFETWAVLGNTGTLSQQESLPSSNANLSGANVVSIDAKRRRFVSPRRFASVAAALAACAFAATTLLNNSPKVASTDLAIADTTVAAAAEESAAVAAAETTALAATETVAAAAPADQAGAAARVAPAAESAPDTDALANDVLSFDGETGSTQSGSSDETTEPAPPPAAKQSAPKATFPVTTLFQPEGSSERAGTTPPLLPEGRVTTTRPPAGADIAAGAAPAAPAPPVTVIASAGVTTVAPNVQTATPSQDAVVLPTLLQGTFLNVQDVRDKLIADPTIASPDTEGPCGKELRAWLISSGAEQAGPRFVRARVADRVLTFAIATPVGKPAVVVVADEACRQLS
jgi:hypothetical protein